MKAKQLLLFLSQFIKTRVAGQRFRSRVQLEAWQEKKIIKHAARVRKQSTFYQEWWAGKENQEWRTFPIINKSIMMEHFNDLNTVGIRKEEAMEIALRSEQTRDFQAALGGVTIGLSSGTSGNRGLFLVSENERIAWAGTVLAKLAPTVLFRRERIAFFLRANSELYQSVRQKRVQFEYYDLLLPLDEHISRLNATNPSILVAPPSLLRMLAHARQNGHLQLFPSKIISVAEVLDPLDRAYIEKSFELTLHQVYQCTEGFLASTCPYGTLHLNEDIVHIEKAYVDEPLGKFIPIITDFSRVTQPIIRYRLDDILTESKERCPCGSAFTAISSIDGRCDDLFYIPSEQEGELIPVFPDFVSRAIIQASEHVEEYEVIQTSPESVTIHLRVKEEHRAAAEISVRQQLDELCIKKQLKRIHCSFEPIAITSSSTPKIDRKLRRIRKTWT